MAATKIEISGPKSLFSNEFLCNSTTLLISRKRRTVKVRMPVAATAAFTAVQMEAKLIELDSIKVIPETPVQFAVSGKVTVEYDAMEQMKELMFNWWDSSKTAIDAQRGVFLQLVSSDIDPSSVPRRRELWGPWSYPRQQQELKGVLFEKHHPRRLPSFRLPILGSTGETSPEKRIFFTNKAYLPNETPMGLRELREKALRELRGNGEGVRVLSDRIYDYDIYNDLGNPDKGLEFARPDLGGQRRPYPRRCRTGRPSTNLDPKSESPANEMMPMYVPRDEAFSDGKRRTVDAGSPKGMMNNLFPFFKHSIEGDSINSFADINNLYKESRNRSNFPVESTADAFKFDPPNIVSSKFLVFPPVSKLDPSIYGPTQSALREEHLISHLDGMSVQQFDTLKPIAIELSLPSMNPFKPSKQVITPPEDATSNWQWQLAKAHVCSNDSGAHELIQHWLRTHACMEPFIIAARRHLSVMHPIHKLLHPHMRYTMDINARARELLINADGIIESLFSTKECSMEITSLAYKNWRFDMESLPADLIRRGIAEQDPTEPHGIKLLIEDYPYANDGLLIWSAIERLVKDYVNHYYPDSNSIRSDSELNTWYYESINVGHADLRHETWWPKLSTPDDLVSILATLIWISSAKHAALNFGQYHYGGYVPVRPPYMRRLIPNEDDPEYSNFVSDPEGYFLSSLPSLKEMTFLLSVLDMLSTHSDDEEYLGDRKELSTWRGNPEIIEAFYRFSMEMKAIERRLIGEIVIQSLEIDVGLGFRLINYWCHFRDLEFLVEECLTAFLYDWILGLLCIEIQISNF
ncbi:hypothetical protein GOBAR_AA06747 [Gossypium barbadense]|uniref:Lipoxygenase n=1 Tax=Gossypium barbadense TaxID=3634 RepID=A0A2P5YDY4_GOSBA|nr:hypothetical protein GOBAR_AA06747 [Gossypium barbadense]